MPIPHPPLTLVDVGGRGGFPPKWAALADHAQLVGVDADPEECRRLAGRSRHLPGARFEAVALADRPGEAVLHVARDPGS